MSDLWKLPATWCWTTMGDAAQVIGGGTPSTTNPKNFEGSIPWITPADMSGYSGKTISSGARRISEQGFEDSGARWLPQGTVLFSSRAPIGYVAIASQPVTTNQGFKSFVPMAGLSSDYIYYWLASAKRHAEALASGTTFLELSGAKAALIPLPLPPTAEQTRIVAKLEELLADLDAGVAELKAAQKKLAQYRQSLLKAAVEGTLTAEWREAQRKRHSTPLSPRGRGVGGEGVQALNTSDETWFRDRARQLRQEQTPMEQLLWQQLRAKRFSGFKFRRQQKIGRYIVDFVCFAQKLIIELDGSQHADAQVEGATRDHWLRGEGFRVLRFWNNELLGQTDAVLEAIWQALQQEPPLPSPTRGEGLESETGAQLLERILQERRARWEVKQLAKFQDQGKTPPRDWQNKYPEPVQPDTTGLPDLPEGWVWASVDQIAEVFLGKMLDKTKHTSGRRLPYLRNVNIRWGSIDIDDVYEMFFDDDEIERYGLLAGDVLVCEGGEPGRAAICKKKHENFKYQKALHRVRLFNMYEPELLIAFLEFVAKTGQLARTFTGSTINHFTKESFLALPVPVPSLAEQREIVESISLVAGSIDDHETAIKLSLKQSAAQRQNILRAAFAGQLVPQDPNDEPASVLLERIRAERAALAASKKTRSRKTKETSS